MKTGRNDPCPCGSGKKYKKCCLAGAQAQKVEDITYRRYRDIESKLIDRLFQHALEVFGPSSIEEAWNEFHCWNDPDGYDPESPLNQIFGPYFLFSWEIDPEDTECDKALVGKTVAETFISAKRTRLTKEELEILEATNRSLFAFYEIIDVNPGEGFTLRNVLTEREYEVTERSGSRGASKGDVMFGALFEIKERHQTLAMSPYMLPPISIQALMDVRKRLQKQLKLKVLKDSQIADFDIELREVYFSLLEPLLNPQMPKLCNTDGDPLVPQTLYFDIQCPDEAFSALKSVTAGFVSEAELRADAKIKDGKIYEVEIPWFKRAKSGSKSGSNTVLGTLNIAGKRLTVNVNSNKRASTIKKKIETKLGSAVKFKTKVIESIEGNIGREAAQGGSAASAIPLDQLPPEALDAVKKMADEHWNKWFDEKIPALNGKTPKQAAKSKEGRELLSALLNSYEQRASLPENEATNLFQPDVDKLREKLGLN